MSTRKKHIYEFGPYRVDAANQRLTREGEPVPLEPKTFDTLLALVEHRGELLDKNTLMEMLWPEQFVEESNLAQNIYKLRKALGQERGGQPYIETVPKRGYRLAADVREVSEEEAELLVEEFTRTLVVIDEEGAGDAARRRPAVRHVSRLAVLPFAPLGADEEDKYAGLAMADSLITKLGGIARLVLRPTNAVRRYMGVEPDPVAAGRELRADAVLTGTVQRSGGRVRVNVQLTDVEGESLLWAGRLDEPFTDVFALQDVISERVARALLAHLGGEERERLRRHYTQNPEAFRAYARGLYHMNRYTPDGLRKAVESFALAAELSPEYAPAQVGLAQVYHISAGWTEASVKALRASALAARKALDADDSLAEAHALAAASKFWGLSNVESAEAGFLRALELDPNSVAAHHWYGWFLTATGRFDEAERELRAALELDPLSLALNTDLGMPYYYAGRYDEAAALYLKTLELEPHFGYAHYRLGLALVQTGDYERAAEELALAGEFSQHPDVPLAAAYVRAAAGRESEARAVLEELFSSAGLVSPYEVAAVYAALGEGGRVLEWLGRAYVERDRWLRWLEIDPRLSGFRPDQNRRLHGIDAVLPPL